MHSAAGWLLPAALVAVAAAVYGVALDALSQSSDGPLALAALAVAFFAALAGPARISLHRRAPRLSLLEVPFALGLVAVAPRALLAALLLGSAAATTFARRRSAGAATFDLLRLALAGAAGIAVFRAIAPGAAGGAVWPAAIAATMCFAALVSTLGPALRAADRRPLRPRDAAAPALAALLGAAAMSTLTLAAYRLVRADALASLLLVVPAAVWLAAVRSYLRERTRHEHLEFLVESMREVQAADDFADAVDQLLRQLARALDSKFAELLFLGGRSSSGEIQVFTYRDPEVASETRPIRGEERLVLVHAVLSDRAVVLARTHRPHPLDDYLGAHGLGDAMFVPLRGEERELGAIVVGNRAGHAAGFSTNDSRLFETFAAHAAVLLENDQLGRSLESLTRLEAKLRHQAYHDALTGLANRAAFIEATSEALARDATPPVILFVDLDDFKTTNDSLGHAAGDALLGVAAQRVASCLRAGDLAARLGGDEFAVLLHGARLADAREIARRIEDRLAEPIHLDGHECSLRGSIGIAVAREHATAELLLRDADLAMYAAKEGGNGSHAVFLPEMQRRVRARHQLAAALSHSLERQELEVVYQPIVALEGGRVTGFEALLRWNRGGGEVVQPAEFLTLAERTGMIRDIGRFVLGEACRRAAQWQRHEPGISVSVNLSAAELHDPTLLHEIKTLLGATGLDAGRLTIEVTEAAAMTDAERTRKLLTRLRELGVRIALDDFGTGYSSLSCLDSLPLDILKVPKELVDRLRGEQPQTVILGGIQALARALGLALIAEGVEDSDQLLRLRELGYSEAQGFLFGPVLAAEEAGPAVRRQAPLPELAA